MNMKKSNNRGFTLIDVICAVTILMLVVLPIFTGFLMAAKTNARMDRQLEARMTLQNLMEEIKAKGTVAVDEPQITLSFAKGNVDDTELPKGAYTITKEEGVITLDISQEKVISSGDDNRLAYYVITLTYSDAENEIEESLTGVYSPW